jgi:hypothetical protein
MGSWFLSSFRLGLAGRPQAYFYLLLRRILTPVLSLPERDAATEKLLSSSREEARSALRGALLTTPTGLALTGFTGAEALYFFISSS